MSQAAGEKELYPYVSAHFISQGYFVVSGCRKPGVEGTSEFGFVVDDQDMRADVVAARWDDAHQLETVAVECKRLGSMTRSLGAGLWQAIDYQVAFDRVFIATEDSGKTGNKRSVMESLGIGHLSVGIESKKCEVLSYGEFRNGDRFDELVRARQVVPRLALFLAFRDVFGLPLRYGETFAGGGYIAKNVAADIQYNSWFDANSGKSYFGINIEHIDSFRKILASADWGRFQRCLELLEGCNLTLVKDPVPAWRSPQSVRILGPVSCPDADVVLLTKAVSQVIEDRPRHWRPHLKIALPIWSRDERLFKEEYTSRVLSAKNKLSDVMGALTASIQPAQ